MSLSANRYQEPLMPYYPVPAKGPGPEYNDSFRSPFQLSTNLHWRPPPQKDELISPLAYSAPYSFPPGAARLQPALQYSVAPKMQGSSPPSVPRSTLVDLHSPKRSHQYLGSAAGSSPSTRPLSGMPAPFQGPSHSPETRTGQGPETRKSQRQRHSLGGAGAGRGRHKKATPSLVCDQCGKTFVKAYNLKSHSKSHSSERPYKCSKCPKAFARSHDKTRHEQLHGGVKNFKCEGFLKDGVTRWGCGKSFARSDALSRHFRTETGWSCVRAFMDEAKGVELKDGRASPQSVEMAEHARHVYPSGPVLQVSHPANAQSSQSLVNPQLQKQAPQLHFPQITHGYYSVAHPGEWAAYPVSLPPLLRH